MKHQIFRVYCDGRDFGVDYATRADALEAANRFAAHWTRHKYTVRAISTGV